MVAERKAIELEIVDLDIATIKRALGRNWHYEPRNAAWFLKSQEDSENGARISLIVASGGVTLEWHCSGEEESKMEPTVYLRHVISIEPNEFDDDDTWEDVDSGKVDAPGITIKGKSGFISLIPTGNKILLQATIGDFSMVESVPNPGGSR